MDFLKSIDFSNPTIVAAIIGGVCAVIVGIIAAFIAKGKGNDNPPSPLTPSPSPPPVIQQPSPFQSLHQIPSPDGNFIGREKELQELRNKVKQSGVHISGIRGMGGIGKTQLAYRLVEELKPQYPDAQIYLDLKGVMEDDQKPLKPEEALAHVIQAFEPEIQLPETVDQLRSIFLSILDKKKVILLMDNAFDENQTKPLISPKGSLLLVTSRKNFSLPGIHQLDLNTLPKEKSIELLLKISDRIGDHAEQIAERCGYLPKALKVAGKAIAEYPDLSPEEYIEELKKNEGLEPVERSLAASCKWLDEAQRNYFYRLCVFPGSFDSRAVATVWENDEGKTKKTLSNFVNISLVEWTEETKRYHLHDLTRVFARKQLKEQEHYATQKQHAGHYLKVLLEANALYEKGGDNMLAGLQLFDLEWENIETGQAWAANHSATDGAATRMANEYPNAGSQIFLIRLHPQERIQWRETGLAASQKLKIRDFEGCHLSNLGNAFADLDENQKAIDYQKQSLHISQEIGDKRNEGVALINLGNAFAALGDNQKAIDYQKQALQIAREIGDKLSEGITLGNLGFAYNNLGEFQKAIEYSEKRLEIAEEIGDKRGEGYACWNMSLTMDTLGERARAIELAEKVLKIHEVIGHPDTEEVRKQLEEWKKEN